MKWLGTSQLVSRIIRAVAVLVLTQFLTPREFGVGVLLTVVTGLSASHGAPLVGTIMLTYPASADLDEPDGGPAT